MQLNVKELQQYAANSFGSCYAFKMIQCSEPQIKNGGEFSLKGHFCLFVKEVSYFLKHTEYGVMIWRNKPPSCHNINGNGAVSTWACGIRESEMWKLRTD